MKVPGSDGFRGGVREAESNSTLGVNATTDSVSRFKKVALAPNAGL